MASLQCASSGQWLDNPAEILQTIQDSQQKWIVKQASYHDVAIVLKKNCRRVGLEFHGQTPGDGNCFFHAVSDQLDLLGLPSQSAADLRQSVVKFMRSNSTIPGTEGIIDFKQLYPDWSGYCNKMAQDGEWADHVVLVATAHLLQRDIKVVTSSPQSQGDQTICWIRSGARFNGKPIMLGHLWEWHYQSLLTTNPHHKDDFIRLQLAVQYLCQEALPWMSETLKNWHSKQTRILQPCQTPQQCTTKAKPKAGRSCPACVDWGDAIVGIYYKHGQQNVKIPWSNVNPTRLHRDHLEVAKAFVIRLVPDETYNSLGDFDAARLLLLMMNCIIYHGNDPSIFDRMKKVSTIRNSLSHKKINDNFYFKKSEMESHFQDLDDFLQALIIRHPKFFTDDMRKEMWKFKSYQVTPDKSANEQTEANSKSDEFDVIACQQQLRHFYRHTLCKIPQFPGVKGNCLKMDDIYTNLSILINLPKPCAPIQIPLKSHHEIFTPRDKDDVPPSRILVLGNPGCGKSVLTLKLAHDWAMKNAESPLKKVDLLFVLNMRWMTPETTLEDSIFQQLLPNDTEVSKTSLHEYIKRNQSACIILFDSFDEYGFSGDFSAIESGVHGILLNTCLRECKVLVTSRFWKASEFVDLQDVYTQMQISGFSEENVKKYVSKFFVHDKSAGEKLLAYLIDHNLNPGIANVPLMTLLFCLYWKESGGKDMPSKIGDLYSAIFRLLQKQYLSKNIKESINLGRLIKDSGKVALSGLWSTEDKLVFGLQDYLSHSSKDTLTAGCKIGLLSMQQQSIGTVALLLDDIDGSPDFSDNDKCITFFHKSCQEKCAGEYLADLYDTNRPEFEAKMQYLDSVKTCMRVEMILRFACGASSEVAHHILHRLMHVFKSKLSLHLDQYYQEILDPEHTKYVQKFIELCLQCYYECPGRTESHPLLSALFPNGQILFIGMSPYTSSAIGQYISRAKTTKSVAIKAIPFPGNDGKMALGVILKTYNLMRDNLKRLPKNQLQLLYQQDTPYSNSGDGSDFFNLCKTEVANYFKGWQSSYGVNLLPIFASLVDVDGLDTLSLTNVILGNQITMLQRVINHGSLLALRTLILNNNRLSSEQVTTLLDSIQHNLPKLVELDISRNPARLSRLGNCLVNSKIQELYVFDMETTAADMRDVVSQFPQFGSRMLILHIDRNEIDDDTGKELAKALPCARQLQELRLSVDMMKRNTHNKVIKAMHHLIYLTHLRVWASPYVDDLFQHLSSTMESLPQLHNLLLKSSQCAIQQSSQSTLARFLPWLHSKDELATDSHFQHVKRSACKQFISRLDTMEKMRELDLWNIRLHKEDLLSLLAVCHRHKYAYFRYSRDLFPDDIDASLYEFLAFA